MIGTLENLMRRDVVQMTPYTPIKPFHVLSRELGLPAEQIVKLDANENPYGASPRALAALQDIPLPIYPDPSSLDLRERLAERLGVDSDRVMVGAGADELIELLFKIFINPGDGVINCPPTFGMYTFCCDVFGANEIIIERDDQYQLDIDAIEQAIIEHRPKMILLTSPNNPDGSIVSRAHVMRLLAHNLIVVLDEAYIAFAEPDLTGEFGADNSAKLVLQHPNLVVLRTFSKWAGLAGLRCGYGVFAPEIVRYMMTVKQPYNINVAARAAALASLDDLAWLAANVQHMLAERDRLYAALGEIDYLRTHPGSLTNFILTEVIGRSAAELKADLAQAGVLVRYFAKPRLENHLRISVGTPAQTDRLMEVLQEVV